MYWHMKTQKLTRKPLRVKINLKTNNFTRIKPLPKPGVTSLIPKKYAFIILVPDIQTGTVLFILNMLIWFIAVTWYLTAGIHYVDRSAGANIKSWMEVLDKAIHKFDKKTIFVFGHSGNGYNVRGTTDDLKAFQDYLGNVLKFTEAEIKAGKTKEEILKATLIPGGEDWKTDGIQRPLTAAWEELMEQ